MPVFVVYVRSMSTYTDHNLHNLQYENVLDICQPIGYFNNNLAAEKWILSKGLAFTEEFYQEHNQGCAFQIIQKSETIDSLIDGLDEIYEIMNLYFTNKYTPSHVFSEESYQMCLKEHMIYLSHDWDTIFPFWIRYYWNNKVIIGCNATHFKKLFQYYTDDDETMKKQLECIENYEHDLNRSHLKQLPGYFIYEEECLHNC